MKVFGAEEGFSLMEMLVAAAILSFTAVALLDAQSGSLRISARLENKELASIVADNQITEALYSTVTPSTGMKGGQEAALGVTYQWERSVKLLREQDLLQITVTVEKQGEKETLVKRIGYRSAS